MSALEQNAQIARQEGDLSLFDSIMQKLQSLSQQSEQYGATRETHPGLFSFLGRKRK